MSLTIRTFIAVDLNPRIKKTIKHIQNYLDRANCDVKWVKPENIHLTLKFLGDINIKEIDALTQLLSNLLQNIKPIETEFTLLNAFPDISQPHIIWAGLKDDSQKIAHLVKFLEKSLGRIGFKEEQKPFRPHITIGRIRTQNNISNLSHALSDYTVPDTQTQTIKHITLYKSTLTSHAPIYDKLATFDLHND